MPENCGNRDGPGWIRVGRSSKCRMTGLSDTALRNRHGSEFYRKMFSICSALSLCAPTWSEFSRLATVPHSPCPTLVSAQESNTGPWPMLKVTGHSPIECTRLFISVPFLCNNFIFTQKSNQKTSNSFFSFFSFSFMFYVFVLCFMCLFIRVFSFFVSRKCLCLV